MEEGTRDILDATLKFTRRENFHFSRSQVRVVKPGSCSKRSRHATETRKTFKNSHPGRMMLINLKQSRVNDV